MAAPPRYCGGNSPWPTLMPPDSVPELLYTRLLAIWMLCPQPCTKMPPPPCELSVMLRPSMLDGLHQKLLGNGFGPAVVPQVLDVSNVVPSGKPPASPPTRVGSHGLTPWKSTPFDNTVIPAPSSAPISEGSCNSSARLPLRVASQPTVASSGSRSTCGFVAVAVNPNQSVPAQFGLHEFGEPSTPSPNRQTTRVRQSFSLPAGWVFALMTLEAAPTPCSRTGFHISSSSWWAAWVWTVVLLVHATGLVGAAAVLQVGSMMIRSPGLAASIAAWIEPEAATWVGALPPTVTVTVSTDC